MNVGSGRTMNNKEQLGCSVILWNECVRVTLALLKFFKNHTHIPPSSQLLIKFSQNQEFKFLVEDHGYTKILNAVFEEALPEMCKTARKNTTLWNGLIPGTYITAQAVVLCNGIEKYYQTLPGTLPAKQLPVTVGGFRIHPAMHKTFGDWPIESKIEYLTLLLNFRDELRSKQNGHSAMNFLAANLPPGWGYFNKGPEFVITEILDEVYPNWFTLFGISNPNGRYVHVMTMLGELIETVLTKIEEYIVNKGVVKMAIANTVEEKTQTAQPKLAEAETTEKTSEVYSPKPTTVRDIVNLRRLADTSHVITVMLESVREIEERRYTQGGLNGVAVVMNKPIPNQGMMPNWSNPNDQGTLFTKAGVFGMNALNHHSNVVKLTEEQLARADELMLQLVDTLFPKI